MNSQQIKTIAALGAVYVIWGSTYLAIRFCIETMPGFMMAGLRFIISGALLYLYCLSQGIKVTTTLKQWRSASIIGGLLLLGGNGAVVWAEHFVPSGFAALIIAMTPWFIVLLEWLMYQGKKPHGMVMAGLVLGLGGVLMLLFPVLKGHLHPMGVVVLILACLWWAIGSLYSRKVPLPKSIFLSTAMQMIAGGVLLLIVSIIAGEWHNFTGFNFSIKSWVAFVYLILFGSLVGFSAYIWLLQNVTPSLASTYAFVNPLVAVFLGWVLAGERLTPQTMLAACLIVPAVVFISLGQKKPG